MILESVRCCLMRENISDICTFWKKTKFQFPPYLNKSCRLKRERAHINPELWVPKFKVCDSPETACMAGGGGILVLTQLLPWSMEHCIC